MAGAPALQCVIGFDMETDIGSWTPFYTGLEEGTSLLLQVMAAEAAEATFFFTGEAARTHPEIVQAVAAEGQEIGCHSLYHETVGDEIFPIPGIKPLLPEEIGNRLRLATEWVREAAGGSDIVSFRAPRLWGSTQMVNALEDLGYLADASYPLFYYQERLEPYHPSSKDWTAPGDLRIVEIPNFADMGMESVDTYGRDRDQWPLFRTKGAEELLGHIDSYVSYVLQRGVDPVVLCFYFHPWEFVTMPQGLIHYGEGSVLPDPVLIENCGPEALGQLRLLIAGLKTRGCTFHSARDLAALWS